MSPAKDSSGKPARLVWSNARFVLGAARAKQFPLDEGWEVAVAGRSNAGKSSAINVITGQKSLARISKTPGRTREINFFQFDEDHRLVDLPGYGYARVPIPVKQAWLRLMDAYFRERQCLRGLLVVMDCRHPLTDYDQQMLEWCQHGHLPVHVLLTKADKLSRGAAMSTLHQVRDQLSQRFEGTGQFTVQLFSSLKRSGVDEAREIIENWMDFGQKKAPV